MSKGNENKLFAVLTGDLVKSRKLPFDDLEAVRSNLLAAVETVSGWQQGLVRGKAEFFRGDAWQVLLDDPGQALRVAVFLRAQVRAQDLARTRVSIGLGGVDHIDEERVSLSTGEAFVLSGNGLDELKKATQMTVELPDTVGPVVSWVRASALLCDAIVQGWTARQAEIVALEMGPEELTYDEIAARLAPKVTKQAVSKALGGANWEAVRGVLKCFSDTRWRTSVTAG